MAILGLIGFGVLIFIYAYICTVLDIDIQPSKKKNNRNNRKKNSSLWEDEDHSYHFDEDPDMHEVDEDGYCLECDEYVEDIQG